MGVDVDRKMKEGHDMWLVLERLGISFEGFKSPEERVSVEVYQGLQWHLSFPPEQEAFSLPLSNAPLQPGL